MRLLARVDALVLLQGHVVVEVAAANEAAVGPVSGVRLEVPDHFLALGEWPAVALAPFPVAHVGVVAASDVVLGEVGVELVRVGEPLAAQLAVVHPHALSRLAARGLVARGGQGRRGAEIEHRLSNRLGVHARIPQRRLQIVGVRAVLVGDERVLVVLGLEVVEVLVEIYELVAGVPVAGDLVVGHGVDVRLEVRPELVLVGEQHIVVVRVPMAVKGRMILRIAHSRWCAVISF